MRTQPPYQVIIADRCTQRIQLFAKVLEDVYETSHEVVGTWDSLRAELKLRDENSVDLVVLADGLPGRETLAARVAALGPGLVPDAEIVVIVSSANRPTLPGTLPEKVHLAGDKPPRKEVESILGSCLRPPSPPSSIVLRGQNRRILIEMVRSLDVDGRRDRADCYLGRMIRDVGQCVKATVTRLTQGYSGAKVLHVSPESGDTFVLKISAMRDLWRIRNELDHWKEIEGALAAHGLKRHIPHLLRPQSPCAASAHLVMAGGFYAAAYQFLGGGVGAFLSLEEVYTLEAERLKTLLEGTGYAGKHEELAEPVLDDVLKYLRKPWYSRASVDSRLLWSSEDAPPGEVLAPPPYHFRPWQKARMLGALERLEGLGKRLFPDSWDHSTKRISDWLESAPNGSKIERRRRVVLSAVHGDLNSNNILVWVGEAQPFLIDFTYYQSRGHTMQDFARLEAEIKFVLMDREIDSRLTAMDLTPDRVKTWCAAEDRITAGEWDEEAPLLGKEIEPVRRAFGLIDRIRREARDIRTAAFEGHTRGFTTEYRVALLFHTLRAIGYEALSPFKRLLAVNSAAALIERLS